MQFSCLFWADIEISNLILNACIGETIRNFFQPGKNWRSVKLADAPIVCSSEPVMGRLKILRVIITLPSDLVLINVLSVTVEIRPKVLLKTTFDSRV